mmetsp:Transcript_14558/g.37007  ORF Transcript_14558/g.37007 Transcript_14558/m.37007 type:complete len:222 (+) Transcript_14558:935-1600(+)
MTSGCSHPRLDWRRTSLGLALHSGLHRTPRAATERLSARPPSGCRRPARRRGPTARTSPAPRNSFSTTPSVTSASWAIRERTRWRSMAPSSVRLATSSWRRHRGRSTSSATGARRTWVASPAWTCPPCFKLFARVIADKSPTACDTSWATTIATVWLRMALASCWVVVAQRTTVAMSGALRMSTRVPLCLQARGQDGEHLDTGCRSGGVAGSWVPLRWGIW